MTMKEIIEALTPALIGVAVAIIGLLCESAKRYFNAQTLKLSEQTENSRNKYFIELLDKAVTKAVDATNQNLVEGLKNASADGKLTADEAKEVFSVTKNSVLSSLTQDGREALNAIYGDLSKHIDTMIASQVRVAKREDKNVLPMNTLTALSGVVEPIKEVEHLVTIEEPPINLGQGDEIQPEYIDSLDITMGNKEHHTEEGMDISPSNPEV